MSLVEKYQRVESIVGRCETGRRPAIYWVTSSEWAKFAEEVAGLGYVVKGGPERKPTPTNFHRAKIGKNLEVVNAGTDNEGLVNSMNAQEAPIDFQHKRDQLRTG